MKVALHANGHFQRRIAVRCYPREYQNGTLMQVRMTSLAGKQQSFPVTANLQSLPINTVTHAASIGLGRFIITATCHQPSVCVCSNVHCYNSTKGRGCSHTPLPTAVLRRLTGVHAHHCDDSLSHETSRLQTPASRVGFFFTSAIVARRCGASNRRSKYFEQYGDRHAAAEV